MPQFLVAAEDISAGAFILKGDEARHVRVLRLRPGEPVRLFDGTGRRWLGRLDRTQDGLASGAVLEQLPEAAPSCELHLHLAMLPRERFEDALEKTAELGIASLQPVRTERSVAHWPDSEEKRARLDKIALAACKQSLRARPPRILAPADLAQALQACAGRALIAWEGESGRGVLDAAAALEGSERHVFIGPEGGFTADEIESARRTGALTFSLGANILRAETAAVAAAALLLIPLREEVSLAR